MTLRDMAGWMYEHLRPFDSAQQCFVDFSRLLFSTSENFVLVVGLRLTYIVERHRERSVLERVVLLYLLPRLFLSRWRWRNRLILDLYCVYSFCVSDCC